MLVISQSSYSIHLCCSAPNLCSIKLPKEKKIIKRKEYNQIKRPPNGFHTVLLEKNAFFVESLFTLVYFCVYLKHGSKFELDMNLMLLRKIYSFRTLMLS